MIEERFAFSVDEAAVRCGLGRDRLYAAIRDGQLAAKKAGRRTLVTAEALRLFIENLPPLQLPTADSPGQEHAIKTDGGV